MIYFVTTTEETLEEELAQLFRDNVQKLYELLESIMSDKRPQFVAEMIKKLNSMLGTETKLLTSFHFQTNRQIEYMNQELEQYLQFFVDHRQKDQLEQLVSVEFAINNKVHSTTKVSLFIVNYRRELRIRIDIKKKEYMEKTMEFAERMKKVYKEAGTALKKT